MKFLICHILSFLMLAASLQNGFLAADYFINQNFYEQHCINKNKPELNCHGKCEVKKESQKQDSSLNFAKAAFDFNILPETAVDLPLPKILVLNKKSTPQFFYVKNLADGYIHKIPNPPQI